MTTHTQTCRDCKATLPLTPEHWRRAKKNRTGYSTRCKPCDSARVRAYKQAREATMTEAEWDVDRARKREHSRAWKAKNPDKVQAHAARYRLMESIPAHLDELRELRRLQIVRDDFEGWKARAQSLNEELKAELGGDFRATMNDARYISITETEDDLMRLECKGRRYLDRRLEELKAAFESYSEDDIRIALERAENKTQGAREPNLSPACRRWLARALSDWQRREDALTDDERAARAAKWAALWAELDSLDDDYWHLMARAERKAELRERDLWSRR